MPTLLTAQKLAKELKVKGRAQRNEVFTNVQDNLIKMMLEVNAVDQKGRMELRPSKPKPRLQRRRKERRGSQCGK